MRVVAPAAVIVSMIEGGVAFGSGPLTAVGGLIALLAAVVLPEVGLAVLVCVASLKAPLVFPAPGLNLLLVGALLLGCIYRLPVDRPRPHLRISPSLLLLLTFVFYVGVQQSPEMVTGWAGERGRLIGYYFFQILTGLGIIVAAAYILRGRSPYPVLAMALAGAVIAAGVAVATFDNPTAGPQFGNLVATADTGQRAAGPFGNPNYLGFFVAAALVATIGAIAHTSSRYAKVVLVGVGLLFVVALLESQSRGAMIAAFAGALAVVWLRRRPLAVVMAGLGVVGALLIYPAFVEWRLTNDMGMASDAGYVQLSESDQARLGGARAAPALFLAEPVFGVGFGQFSKKSVEIGGQKEEIVAHNWYLSVLAEQGSIGALLWFGACVAVLRELRARRGVARMLGFGIFVTVAVGSLFLEAPTSFQAIALPSVFLVAALTSEWENDRVARQDGAGAVNPLVAGGGLGGAAS